MKDTNPIIKIEELIYNETQPAYVFCIKDGFEWCGCEYQLRAGRDFVDIWFTDSLNSKSNILIPKINVVWIDNVDTNFGGVSTVVLSIPEIQVSNLINFSRSESLDLVQIEN